MVGSICSRDQSFYTSRSVLRLGNVARGRIKIFDIRGLPVHNIRSDEIKGLGRSSSMRKPLAARLGGDYL